MNIAVDIGNTKTKIGLFEGDTLVRTLLLPSSGEAAVLRELEQFSDAERIILSSVSADCAPLAEKLGRRRTIVLDADTEIPLKNLYRTPRTLGADRIALAVGANFLRPATPLLVIDAGTAVTYEFVSADGEYLGGNIAPGLRMRLRALNAFTKKIPLVEPRPDFPDMGTDTETAVLAGTVGGMSLEMDAFIGREMEKNARLSVFLTGGDAFFFENRLKKCIFVNQNLLLIGLNRILNYNV